MTSNKNFFNIIKFFKSDEALTEVLGFVTLLGILLLSFSLLGLVGYPALKNAQEARYIENSRQSFVVLADNVNKVALGQTPSQNIEVKMYGGTLQVAQKSSINITANGFNSSTGLMEPITIVASESMGSIENSIGDTVIAYEGTGVWIKYPNGVVLNSYKPFISNSSNVVVIPVVGIYGKSAISGVGLSRVTICQQQLPSEEGGCGTPDVYFFSNVSNITVKINGNYTRGWEDYFKNTIKWNSETDGSYTGRLNATNMDVYILKSWIKTVIK